MGNLAHRWRPQTKASLRLHRSTPWPPHARRDRGQLPLHDLPHNIGDTPHALYGLHRVSLYPLGDTIRIVQGAACVICRAVPPRAISRSPRLLWLPINLLSLLF